jgi:hypothetical protein
VRATTRSDGSIQLVLTQDEAAELVQDGMFDDADTLAVSSRLRDVVQAELDIDLLNDEDDEDEDLDDDDDDEEQIEGLDETRRAPDEEIEGID